MRANGDFVIEFKGLDEARAVLGEMQAAAGRLDAVLTRRERQRAPWLLVAVLAAVALVLAALLVSGPARADAVTAQRSREAVQVQFGDALTLSGAEEGRR